MKRGARSIRAAIAATAAVGAVALMAGCHNKVSKPTSHASMQALGQGKGGPGRATDGTRTEAANAVFTATSASASAATPSVPCATAWCRPSRRGVAVLLPLSGRYRELGQEIRTAIEVAAHQANAASLFVFYDTAGDVTTATAAAQKAMADGYGMLLGPLGRRETAAVIAAVDGAALIAHLSPLVDASVAHHVLRWVMSPQEEGAWVVAIAEAEQFPTVGVFYPDDDTGRLAAAGVVAGAANSEVTSVQVSVPFVPDAKTLASDVRVLLGMVPETNAELRRHLSQNRKQGMKTFTPQPGFSLLYVPAAYDVGALVASYLPYYNVELRSDQTGDTLALRRKYRGDIPEVVQLVGPSNWATEGFLSRAGAAAEGAYVLAPCPGAYAAGSPSEQIEGDLRVKLKRRPSELAMQAHDAASLLIGAITATSSLAAGSHGANPRDTGAVATEDAFWPPALFGVLTAALEHATLADGACGAAAMTSHGSLARQPMLLTVKDGAIAPAQW